MATAKKKTVAVNPKLINLQLTKEQGKAILSQIESELDNYSYADTEFDAMYTTYRTLKTKLAN